MRVAQRTLVPRPLVPLCLAFSLGCASRQVQVQRWPGETDEPFVHAAVVTVASCDRLLPGQDHPECRPLSLSSEQSERLHTILSAAAGNYRRQREENRMGGVGCRSFDYKLTFEAGGTIEEAWLHLKTGWLGGGGKRVGFIPFSLVQRAQLEALLGAARSCT